MNINDDLRYTIQIGRPHVYKQAVFRTLLQYQLHIQTGYKNRHDRKVSLLHSRGQVGNIVS